MLTSGIVAKSVQYPVPSQAEMPKNVAKTAVVNPSDETVTVYGAFTSVEGASLNLSEEGLLLSRQAANAYMSQAFASELAGLPQEDDSLLNTITRQSQDDKGDGDIQMYIDMLKQSKQSAEAAADTYDQMAKALTIARRLMHGDTVPLKDEKLLMEYSGELYLKAKMMGSMADNDDPKHYRSLLDDEEEASESSSASAPDAPSESISEVGGIEVVADMSAEAAEV